MQARAREAMRAARTVLLQLVHLPHRANLLVSLSFAPLSPSFSFPGMPPLTGVSIDADQRQGAERSLLAQRFPLHTCNSLVIAVSEDGR